MRGESLAHALEEEQPLLCVGLLLRYWRVEVSQHVLERGPVRVGLKRIEGRALASQCSFSQEHRSSFHFTRLPGGAPAIREHVHLSLLPMVHVAGQSRWRKGLVWHVLAPWQQATAILFVLDRHQLSVHRCGGAEGGRGGTNDGQISERFGEQSAQSMRLAQLIIEEPLDVIALALKVALSDLRLQKT